MATLGKGQTFGATEQVTAPKLHALVDSGTCTSIVAADITDGVITNAKMNDVSAAKLTNCSSLPVGSGIFPTVNLEAVAWVSYAASSTIVGWSAYTIKVISYKKIGKTVFVFFNISGTSNSTSTSFTLPLASNAGSTLSIIILRQDNGTNGLGLLSLDTASSTVNFYTSVDAATWTATGDKIIRGEFWYEASS